jgi:signal transduction histidine kinase
MDRGVAFGFARSRYRVALLAVVVFQLLGWVAYAQTGVGPVKKYRAILLIHSYHKGMLWGDDITKGIESVLQSEPAIHLLVEYMDTKRYDQPDYLQRLADIYRYKYTQNPPDLLITADDNALLFAIDHRRDIFAGIPIVFCGVNDYENDKHTVLKNQHDVTGVVEAYDIAGTLKTALELHPDTREIDVINDRTVTGQANRHMIQTLIPTFGHRVTFRFFENLTMSQLLADIDRMSAGRLILLMSFNRDSADHTFTYRESIAPIAAHARVPIYGVWSFYLGRGIVGGILTSGTSQGQKAAQLALQVFSGKPAATIPVVTKSPNRPMFDYRQLERFGIDAARLPKGSIIVNTPVTFYSQYRREIWAMAAVFLLLLGIISLLMVNIFRRKAVEQHLRLSEQELTRHRDNLEQLVAERTTRLQKAHNALQDSFQQLKQAQDQLVQSEKLVALGGLVAGMAHEINTPVGVAVTAASFLDQKTTDLASDYQSGGLKRSALDAYLATAREASATILKNLGRAADLVHSFKQVAADQSSEQRRRFELKPYLDEVLLSLRPRYRRTGHRITIECPAGLFVDSFPGAFSQIVTNLLLNALVHGMEGIGEGQIHIGVTADSDQIAICFKDNGRGMTPEALARLFEPFFTTKRGQGGTGLGLHIVYNLVTQTLGGRITCQSQPGKGTQFLITLPLN